MSDGKILLALAAVAAIASAAGCAARGREGIAPVVPAAPPEPRLAVVYPPDSSTLTALDSSFIFGSVSPPGTPVTVNGMPARQARSGGWLAYVPLESGRFVFDVVAQAPGGPAARLEVPAIVPGGGLEAPWQGVLDTTSVTPRGRVELYPGDSLVVRFRGMRGLKGRVVLEALGGYPPNQEKASAPFVEERSGEVNLGRRTFGPATPTDADTGGIAPERSRPEGGLIVPWYRADVLLPPFEIDESTTWCGPRYVGNPAVRDDVDRGACGNPRRARIEIDQGADTLRYLTPTDLVILDPGRTEVVELDDDPSRRGRTDGRVVGRTDPEGVYFLFFPNGTRASTGRRIGSLIELRVARDLSVWTDVRDVRWPAVFEAPPRSLVPVVRTLARGRWTRISFPLADVLPVQIRQLARPARYQVTVFGARAATEFLRYDGADDLVRELRWNQPASDRFVLEVELDQEQPWGYRYGFEGGDFYLDVRRAPRLRGGLFRSLLDGLTIVVDPGHFPDPGAVGPTGFPEKDANLAVALELARELERKGATVVLTRDASTPADSAPGLNDRTNLAARLEADLLVSVHHNALPDGVNPFENNGTAVFYNHPQSLPLARAIQRELLEELGLPDFGIGLGNLALVRATEMPAVLTEAAFMMIPEQEELLRTEEFQRREARAIRRGIERFLKESRAAER